MGVRIPSISRFGRTAQQVARVGLPCLLAAALLSACDDEPLPTSTTELTNTPTPTLTPIETPIPTDALTPTDKPMPISSPTATFTPSPGTTPKSSPSPTTPSPQPVETQVPSKLTPSTTPTPTSQVVGENRYAADYTEDEIAEIASALIREFLDAIKSQPGPDLERAKATYSAVCQPGDEEQFAAQVDSLLETFEGKELSVDIIAAGRLDDHDDAVIVLSFLLVDGERVFGATRSLLVFENGHWLDGDCEESRALFLGPETDQEDGDDDSDGSEVTVQETPTPRHTPVALGDNPADHTDEEIARSVEWVTNDGWEAALEESGPDIDSMRGISVAECRTEADGLRQQLEEVGATRIWIEVQGVERIDDHRAWVTGTLNFGDLLALPGPPFLAMFEDGQWRDGECLVESDPGLQRPSEISPDNRISYIGEPVRLQYDWDEEPYQLTVLGAPQAVDDMTVRLPVRITAITETLDLTYVTYSGWLETEADAEGNVIEWSEDPCEEGVFEDLTLERGDSHETFLCFRGTGYDQEETVPDRPFVRFTSYYGDTLRTVELVSS